MHGYDLDQLWVQQADRLLQARDAATAVGGDNNIRERGDGPEREVRALIQALVGRTFRVTQGHIVRGDERKSKQIDVIVVRDHPGAALHRRFNDGDAELVKAESVAAVGEVKASWRTTTALESYRGLVASVAELQHDLREPNHFRFGDICGDGDLSAASLPVTGLKWLNACYVFVWTLAIGDFSTIRQEVPFRFQKAGIPPDLGSALVLDRDSGGALCLPGTLAPDMRSLRCGVKQFVGAKSERDVEKRRWLVLEPAAPTPKFRTGRLLAAAVSDLQFHLDHWHQRRFGPGPYDPNRKNWYVIKSAATGPTA